MNKTEIIAVMAEKMGTSKKDAETALNAFTNVVLETLADGGDVNLVGFGKFSTKEVPEKTGTIQLGDKKGESYTTPKHIKPTFKFGKTVKDLLKK